MEATSRLDRTEKVVRILLWMSIASACVIVPIEYIGQKRAATKAEAELQEAVKKAEAKAEDLEKHLHDAKSHRVTLASMGPYLASINYSTAQGNLWFTNVSPHAGVMCIVGLVKDPDAPGKPSESIPACQEVGAYASAVHVPLMFGGGDLVGACPKSNCRLTFREAAEHE